VLQVPIYLLLTIGTQAAAGPIALLLIRGRGINRV
jgi:hypothetical protein